MSILIKIIYYLAIPLVTGLLARFIYLVFNRGKIKSNPPPVKTMIILGSGGHTTEMFKLLDNLDLNKYNPRVYVHGHSDIMSELKLKEFECDNDYRVIKIFRSREVGQSFYTSVLTTLIAIMNAFAIISKEKPGLILANGPGTCVPLCLVAFIFKFLFLSDTTVIFIESFCRVKTLSLSGKILYYFADHLILQWPFICREKKSGRGKIKMLTAENLPWDLLVNYCDKIPEEIKGRLIFLIQDVKSALELNKLPERIDWKLMEVEACLDRTWENLNTGYWKDVPVGHRFCYTICSLLKCILLEISYGEEEMEKIAEQVDKGLLLGAPIVEAPELLTKIASKVNKYLAEKTSGEALRFEIDDKNVPSNLIEGCEWVRKFKSPSMETFYRDIFKCKAPAVLEDCIGHWKALKLWKDPDYLIKIGGTRTVPVEIGSSYTEDDWSQKLVTLSEFIKSHVAKKSDSVGYLAQHQLFDQIPELKGDFSIPDYCNFVDEDKEDTEVDINAWFGPKGTISPLHFDPRDNLLCQVFGYKQIILYCPDDSKYLYRYDSRLLSNTAQVNPINPEYNKFPEFKKARGFMCHLQPGQILYIPPKWWHHVVSLSPSFSISFWWN